MFSHVTDPGGYVRLIALDTHIAMTHDEQVIDGSCQTCVTMAHALGVDIPVHNERS